MGVVFDLFRIVRHGVGSRGLVGTVLDALYWVLVTPAILGLLWQANHGELRFYVVLGIGIGSLLYNAVCSPFVVEFLFAFSRGVGRIIASFVHGAFIVVTWPVLAVRSVVLAARMRGGGRPARWPRPGLWRPNLAWRRR